MQTYGQVFARLYNMRWAFFVQHVAPRIRAFYEGTPIGRSNRSVLDLCCGTGQLALHFLERGYHVTGIDISEHMLHHARKNTASYLESGQARFLQADAGDFSLDGRVGLVVSTFDSLNHLDGEEALKGCFRSVFPVLERDGWFIFDLNTRAGLLRWNSINVDDGEEAMIVTRGMYDGQGDRAWTRLSGFLRREDGLYERFEEMVFNAVFDMAWVRGALLETGWRSVHFARIEDLATPIPEPEREMRAWFVAQK